MHRRLLALTALSAARQLRLRDRRWRQRERERGRLKQHSGYRRRVDRLFVFEVSRDRLDRAREVDCGRFSWNGSAGEASAGRDG
jgi:hypothetical protein